MHFGNKHRVSAIQFRYIWTKHVTVNLDPVILSIPIFFVLIGIELIVDYFQSRKKEGSHYRLNDAVANISCGIIDQSTGVFAKVFTVGAYALVFSLAQPYLPYAIPSHWGMYILFFILVDLAYYWSHRISHGVNLFWTGHVVHHQSEDYNLSVALRQGSFQKILMFWIYLPLAALGFPPTWFVISIGFNLLYQFWIHTDLINKMGWFEWIFNTPSHHRVHHGRNPKYIDKNHAGVFIIWDRMFGTFQVEEEHPTFGITRQLDSFNPVWAHVKPFYELWADMKSIPHFTDRVRFLFAAPGWYPASLGGYKAPPVLTGNEQKYQVQLPLAINLYLLVQYALIVLIGALFLFKMDTFTNPQKSIFLVFILIQVFATGSIFDRSKNSRLIESFRIAALGLYAAWVGLVLHDAVYAGITVVATLLAAAWFGILITRGFWNEK
jgi:alkylglycerol monooxygenase